MDMGGLAEMIVLLLWVIWLTSGVLGILIGRLGRSPGVAFLCGASTAVIVGLVAVSFFGIPSWEDFVLICLPPGVFAGGTSAILRGWTGRQRGDWSEGEHIHLTIDLEQKARSHFTLGQRGADGIQRTDDVIREDSDS
jgi:hypothetical protein